MNYKHTQIGYLIIFSALLAVVCFGFVLVQMDSEPMTNAMTPIITMIVMLLVILLMASFSTLTVIIDEDYLKIKFGYGIYRKSLLLKEILSVKTVKNHWYYGWGIRLWLKPRMRIFNVSGFDAIEIKMKNDKIYRIGTDEPQKLEFAIIQVIN